MICWFIRKKLALNSSVFVSEVTSLALSIIRLVTQRHIMSVQHGDQLPLWLLQQDRSLVTVSFLRDGEHLAKTLQPLAQALDVIEDL